MRLKPGKLYRVSGRSYPPFRLVNNNLGILGKKVPCYPGGLMLFLEKGEKTRGRSGFSEYGAMYVPYYFLFGETKVELRKYYDINLCDVLEEVEEILS